MESVGGNVFRQEGELSWFEPVQPLGGIGHLIMTTRRGGMSLTPYDSLNLATHVGDVETRVLLNRKAALRPAGRGLSEPVVGEQVHGSHVQVVGELHAGNRWERRETALAGTDALVTATRRLPLVTLVADCLPVALVCPERQVGAVVHAGWRGLADGILENALGAMKRTWGVFAADVAAWIGPGIGPCCYEVGTDLADHFPGFTQPGPRGRSHLDLRAAARTRLAAAGVVDENLTGLELCTCCRDDLFFSHRRATTREGAVTTGRQALFLWMER